MPPTFKQELVLQLPAESVTDYDALIELEDSVAAGLVSLGKLDGRDVCVGEMNIFVRMGYSKLAF